ncbi:putative flavoprotein [Frankia canadensis]|uniref:Putative flavoprotein n=1 Tax=Frankia canadensis TaxID=1836972 RepID=A0A2I2KNW5_9ACTN|nr:NADPH-dependent FMN reductase [Frankia canadensis]SNQ47367.1 putative flavoprotein [Frankia canadensis]SOU54657.1 putative flavoprotein [Frankia canadensis]
MGDSYGALRSGGGGNALPSGGALPSRTARPPVDVSPAGIGPVRARRRRPVIVGLGGATRADSATHLVLAATLGSMAQAGAETILFGAAELDLPMYAPERPERTPATLRLLTAVERCDALVVATPGYHGAMSGMVKNALDYLEDLRGAPRPYLDGRAVGLIVSATGAQEAGTTLSALRSTVHALRGWPTPLGVAFGAGDGVVDAHGRVTDSATATLLEALVDQIMGFTYAWSQVI